MQRKVRSYTKSVLRAITQQVVPINKTGPNLWGIYGAKAAVQEGYKYSNWLKEAGIDGMMKRLQLGFLKRKKKPHILEKTLRKVR